MVTNDQCISSFTRSIDKICAPLLEIYFQLLLFGESNGTLKHSLVSSTDRSTEGGGPVVVLILYGFVDIHYEAFLVEFCLVFLFACCVYHCNHLGWRRELYQRSYDVFSS